MRQEAASYLQQAVCVRRKETNKKTKIIRPTQNTPRNPQPPGDREKLETARDETRPFVHRSRVCGNQPRLYTYVPKLLLLLRRLYSFWCSTSRPRSFCFRYCDMYLRFRGCPIVLDIELSVSAWYQKTRRALLRARCLLLLLLLAADSREA